MSETKKDEKDQVTSTTRSDEGVSKATTLDERLAEIENKSITFPNNAAIVIPEEKPLVKTEDVKNPVPETEKTPRAEVASEKQIHETIKETSSEKSLLREADEKPYRTPIVFVVGIIMGALITSFFL